MVVLSRMCLLLACFTRFIRLLRLVLCRLVHNKLLIYWQNTLLLQVVVQVRELLAVVVAQAGIGHLLQVNLRVVVEL
jgi:hypothetical protein